VILLLVVAYCRIYRAGHISDDDMLKEAIAPNINANTETPGETTNRMVHPELQYVLKKSKYKGVKFDQVTGSWYVEGMQRMFVNEKEAAQQAYLQKPEFHGPTSVRRSQPPQPPLDPPPGLSSDNPTFAGGPVVFDQQGDIESQQYPFAPQETPEEKIARRKAQLIAFYAYWDADKADAESHVDHLFKRHDFRYIMRAVKTKYGVVPPGWEEEAEYDESTI